MTMDGEVNDEAMDKIMTTLTKQQLKRHTIKDNLNR